MKTVCQTWEVPSAVNGMERYWSPYVLNNPAAAVPVHRASECQNLEQPSDTSKTTHDPVGSKKNDYCVL